MHPGMLLMAWEKKRNSGGVGFGPGEGTGIHQIINCSTTRYMIHTYFFMKLDKNRIQRSLAVFQCLLFCLSNSTFLLSDVCNYKLAQ